MGSTRARGAHGQEYGGRVSGRRVARGEVGPSLVYAIGCAEHSAVKIGTTTRLATRLASLQTGSPFLLDVLWRCEGGRELEEYLHFAFNEHRLIGEWFDFAGTDSVQLITEAAARHSSWRESPAAARLAESSERFVAAEQGMKTAREELKAGIVDVLMARIPTIGPSEVSRMVPYEREYVGVIAKAAGVPPLRAPTVSRITKPTDSE
jgi:hypothetical protein